MARKAKSTSVPDNFPAMFEYLGVDLSQKATSGHVKGVCPFCGDSDPKFYVNVKTGQWDCKHCGQNGNAYIFFHQLWEWSLGETTDKQYRGLSMLRGIPVETLKHAQLAFSAVTQEWLYPIPGNKPNSLTTLAVWREMNGKKLWQWVTGTTSHCFTTGPDTSQEVWVCEGLWDMLVLSLVAKEHTVSPYLIGLPGCGSHHDKVSQHAAGRTVKLFLDHDDSGSQAMDTLVAKIQPCQPASVQRIQWPAKYRKGYDINDLWKANRDGKASLKRTAEKTCHSLNKYLEEIPFDPNVPPEDGMLVVKNLSDVVEEEVPWVWLNRLMDCSVNIVQGDPNLGKSFLYCDAAARVSTGTPWPDGAACPTGKVLIFTDEDHPSYTLRPRIEHQGGDVSQVRFVEHVKLKGATDGQCFDLERDINKLRYEVRSNPGYRLVVIDGLLGYMAGVDVYRPNQTGNVLKMLNAFARDCQICVLATLHLTKVSGENKAMYRGQGSMAIAGTARTIHQICETDEGRVMLPVKMSNGKPPMGMKFYIDDSGLHWNGLTDIDVNDTDSLKTPSRMDRTKRWIETFFGDKHEVRAMEIEAAAKAAGIPDITLRRAREAMGITSGKKGGKGNVFHWSLPADLRMAHQLAARKAQGLSVIGGA